ncbi:hypothetical protein H632_c443p0 [Helicosporidium sp. ATCC 50920]|nr:hypothetical protein H632_c443p0 [Helicosporidium sp. ATCC 50920]|eukprot:KDD75905.1 hypothetical protein H632_c443p0 [Helicosporidium sp. ATCC 50920]
MLAAELQRALEETRPLFRSAAEKPGITTWVKQSSLTEAGTDHLLDALEERLAKEAFEACLARHVTHRGASQGPCAGDESGEEAAPGAGSRRDAPLPPSPPAGDSSEPLGADWWELDSSGALKAVSESTGPYLMVEHSDAVQALSDFIAAYIVTLPEARGLDPAELRSALVGTVAELRRGRLRRLWDSGTSLCRGAAMVAGAFSAYTNPWLARALVSALWTGMRVLGGYAL